MKKTATCLALLAVALLALAAPAGAVNLMSETFTYPDGGLAGNDSWTTHSGTGTDIMVVSGAAAGNMANAPDDNKTFAAQTATAKTYFCFKVNIPTVVGTPSTNYFAHLKDSGTSLFAGRVFVAPSGTSYSFGLSVSSSTMSVQWPSALTYGTDYYVVVDYDAGLGTADLWVNPTSELSPKISATGGTTGILVSSFALRQSSTLTPAGSVTWKYNVDDVGVGTSFADACVSGPTPTRGSTWGRLKTLYR